MAGSNPVTHKLDVPGAALHYQRRGAGPLLVLIGSPMDSTGFASIDETSRPTFLRSGVTGLLEASIAR